MTAVVVATVVAVDAATPPFRSKLSVEPVPVLTLMGAPAAVVSVNRFTPSKVAPDKALVISAPRAL
ncbi:hypothetical protein D3C81_2322710 [compost metagenome]